MDKRVKFDVFQGGKNIDITMFQYGWEAGLWRKELRDWIRC